MPRRQRIVIGVVITWFVAAMGLSAQDVARSSAPTPLTNADVVHMVQAGLSESLVIAAIRQAPTTAFTTTPDALIALKQSGVSEAILTAMMDPAAPLRAPEGASGPDTRTASGDRSDPVARRPPGIYIDLGTTGAPQLAPLEPTAFSQGTSGGLFSSALTYGLAKAKWKAIVRGAKATLRTTIQQPTFYFYTEEPSSALGTVGGVADWFAGASSPNEFVLVQMNVKRDSRELVVGEFNVFGSTTGTRAADTVPLTIERLAPGVYHVTPTEVLGRGEFCFFYAPGAGAFGAATFGKLFDFGVDAPDTAARR